MQSDESGKEKSFLVTIPHKFKNSQLVPHSSYTTKNNNYCKSKIMSMHVIKRDGRTESVHFDKITSRITKLAFGLDSKVRYF